VIGINQNDQSCIGVCAPPSTGVNFHSKSLADPLFTTSCTRWIRYKPNRVQLKAAAAKVSPHELLMAIVLNEDNHLRWPGHLLPSPRDGFRWLEIVLIGRKLCHTHVAILLPEEPKPVEPSPLIQRLRMM